MNKLWQFSFCAGYGPYVSKDVVAVGERLGEILAKHCVGPYHSRPIKMRIDIVVEGAGGMPNPSSGIKIYPFAHNLICAEISVRRVDWDVPVSEYRDYLWRLCRKAIWDCVNRLTKKGIVLDIDLMRVHLSSAEVDLLNINLSNSQTEADGPSRRLEPKESALIPKNRDTALDEYSDYEHQRVVIQYLRDKKNDPWDYERRVEFENLLNRSLDSGKLGFCDCIDYDFSTINAICSVKDAKIATRAIIETLRTEGRLNGAIIEETVLGKRKVVWPEDYVGEIDYT